MAIEVAALSFAQIQMGPAQAPEKRIALFSITMYFKSSQLESDTLDNRSQSEQAGWTPGNPDLQLQCDLYLAAGCQIS